VADSFPASFEVLFRIPASVEDPELRTAVEQLAETLKTDLVVTGAPVEVIMEASVSVSQFAKHMQASTKPYGHVDAGAYDSPGAERAALSSLHTGLTSLREALFKLRIAKSSPAQVSAAIEDRDKRFARCAQELFVRCRANETPLAGEDMMFWVQRHLFGLLKEEGLVE
jgi:hypothetical protein